MSWRWVGWIAESKDVALILSLAFNAIVCTALWRVWRGREVLINRVTELLTELVKEMNRSYWSKRP